MSELITQTDIDPVRQIVSEYRDVLWHYTKAKGEAERFQQANLAIDRINAELNTATHRLVATTNSSGSNTFYGRQEDTGEYVPERSAEFWGAGYSFVGDRLERVGNNLVLVDTSIGGGMEVNGVLQVKSLESIMQFADHRNCNELLERVATVAVGQSVSFDCSYF